MRRVLLVLALMGPADFAIAETLPVPPVPPAVPQLSDAAPVPDVATKVPLAPVSDEPTVAVVMYRAQSYDPGVGFTPGSRYRSGEDRKAIQTPGFSVSVPLK